MGHMVGAPLSLGIGAANKFDQRVRAPQQTFYPPLNVGGIAAGMGGALAGYSLYDKWSKVISTQ